MDAYCIALVLGRDQFRYRAYAMEYTETLLRLQKQVAIFSPDWIELKNDLHIRFRDQRHLIHCFALDTPLQEASRLTGWQYIKRMYALRKRLRMAERSLQCGFDLVYLAPAEDWIKPGTGKKLFEKLFPFYWCALITDTRIYRESGLPQGVDPKPGDPDYLYTSEYCVAGVTLDRFRSETIRDRIYKKTIVMPDCISAEQPHGFWETGVKIRKMAGERMLIGFCCLENEWPGYFFQMVEQAPAGDFFFVLTGAIEGWLDSAELHDQMLRLSSSQRKNFYFLNQDMNDTEALNQFIRLVDVCYMNDGRQEMSHPVLTLAAACGKPVIASRQDALGEIVGYFQTGITLNGQISESVQALQTLRLQMPFKKNLDMKKFKAYAFIQGQEALREAWENLLLF